MPPRGLCPAGVRCFMNYVYIWKSLKDNKQYIGSTNNLDRRILSHNNGQVESTKHRRPFVLFGYQVCDTIQESARLEKSYKRSHGFLERAIKRGDFKLVSGE